MDRTVRPASVLEPVDEEIMRAFSAEELAAEMGMPLEWCEDRLRQQNSLGPAFTADGIEPAPKPTGRAVFLTEAQWLERTRGFVRDSSGTFTEPGHVGPRPEDYDATGMLRR